MWKNIVEPYTHFMLDS